MAIEVELPDGSIAEFPDGTDNATIEGVLKKQFGSGQPTQQPRFNQASVPNWQGKTLDQINDSNRALALDPEYQSQMQANTLQRRKNAFNRSPEAAKFVVGAGSRVPTYAMGAGQLLGVTSEADATAQREDMRFMEDSGTATAGKLTGDAALLAAPGSAIAKLGSFGTKVAAGSGLGALTGAAQPVADGESRATNAGIGALLGAGGETVAKGLGFAARGAKDLISPQIRAMADAAKARGIELTPAQLTDSRMLQYIGDRMKMYPLSGAASRTAKQVGAWNEALSKTLGETAQAITPEVFATAKQRIGDTFEQLTARNTLPVDAKVLDRLISVQQDALSYGDDATGKAVSNLIKRVVDQTNDGLLPGRAYQSIDSEIGKLAKAGGEKGLYLGRIRDALRESMDEAISAGDKSAWQLARAQWRALKTVEPLVAKSETGSLSPASLMGRVTANNAGKSSMASGTAGELGTLARIGQKIKPPPSSGTSERLLGDSVMNPINWPALAARTAMGSTVGRLPNSPFLSRILLSSAPGAALSALARLAPGTTIAGGQLALPAIAKERKRLND